MDLCGKASFLALGGVGIWSKPGDMSNKRIDLPGFALGTSKQIKTNPYRFPK
jgi:hypothetical protein